MNDTFVCIDCETTGLDTEHDRVIEVAVRKFKGDKVLAEKQTLINPHRDIPVESQNIHKISSQMLEGKPSIQDVLPEYLEIIGRHPIIGHGVQFDIDILVAEAKRFDIPYTIHHNSVIDTLRLARHYGEAPKNSLQALREHFHIDLEGAHRAMNDVIVNIEVFKRLARDFKDLAEMQKMLSKPVTMQTMPLGPHKGRPIREVPLEFLRWAAYKDFDQDLLFTIRSELKRRKKGGGFQDGTNPFKNL